MFIVSKRLATSAKVINGIWQGDTKGNSKGKDGFSEAARDAGFASWRVAVGLI